MGELEELEGQSCPLCYDSNDFRVLLCGHAFCLGCLEYLYKSNGGKLCCPMDRKEYNRKPINLPTPRQFQGQLFATGIDDERHKDIHSLIDSQVMKRMHTIQHLRGLAEKLNKMEFKCAVAKISGGVSGILGSVMGIGGICLSLTGIMTPLGVAMAVGGAGIGIAGGVTTGITMAVEGIQKKLGLDDVNKVLQKDYFRAEQLKIVLTRAAYDRNFAKKWNFGPTDASSAASFLPRILKFGLTTAASIRVAFGIGRAATTAGLHVAGLIAAAAIIPIDIAQVVLSSEKLHTKEKSKVVKDILDIANKLEKELRIFLIERDLFQLIYTNDGKWAYVTLFTKGLKQFQNYICNGFTLKELRVFGNIVESGDVDVPDYITKKIQDEWYSHTDELLATSLSESLNIKDK